MLQKEHPVVAKVSKERGNRLSRLFYYVEAVVKWARCRKVKCSQVVESARSRLC